MNKYNLLIAASKVLLLIGVCPGSSNFTMFCSFPNLIQTRTVGIGSNTTSCARYKSIQIYTSSTWVRLEDSSNRFYPLSSAHCKVSTKPLCMYVIMLESEIRTKSTLKSTRQYLIMSSSDFTVQLSLAKWSWPICEY